MRKFTLICAFALVAIAETGAPRVARAQSGAGGADVRTWTARTGGYTTTAALLKSENGVVHLKKQDGNLVSLPLERLVDADQEYVKKWTASNKTATGTLITISQLDAGCRQLCTDITKSYRRNGAGAKRTIAVVEFSNLSGGVSDFGRVLSEELITGLFATDDYKVIERLLLNKVIADHKLQLQGLVDPNSAKELGKILGVDAIVSGTIADLGDSVRVYARLISTETGEVFSVAAATIGKDDAIERLTGSGGAGVRSRQAEPGGAVAAKLWAGENPTGTWKWTTTFGGVSSDRTLKLKQEGDELTGVYIDDERNTQTPIQDAMVAGDKVSFKVTREINGQKSTTAYSGTLKGDTINGKSVRLRDGLSNDWVAKRRK